MDDEHDDSETPVNYAQHEEGDGTYFDEEMGTYVYGDKDEPWPEEGGTA